MERSERLVIEKQYHAVRAELSTQPFATKEEIGDCCGWVGAANVVNTCKGLAASREAMYDRRHYASISIDA